MYIFLSFRFPIISSSEFPRLPYIQIGLLIDIRNKIQRSPAINQKFEIKKTITIRE